MKQRSNIRPLTGTRAVVRAITVLKALGRSTNAYGITELGTATGLSKATVFRLLGALENEGMVARDGSSGAYRLGPQVISLGASALSTTDLRAIAHDELARLAQESGETATLEILRHAEVVVVDEVQGRFLFGATPELGRSWPAHATSTGKVLLALTHPTPRPLSAPRLSRYASRTITTRAELERELARVRHNGYAVAVDELEPGLVAMAAPVRNHLGYVVAALSLNGPGTRLGSKRRRALIPKLCRAANRVSRRLGASVPNTPGQTRSKASVASTRVQRTRASITAFAAVMALFGPFAKTASGQTSSSTNAQATRIQGTLLIVGGGTQPDELVRHFVDLAGGRGKAQIAILPMATSDAVATGAEKEAQLDSLGADSFVLNFSRQHADDDSLVRKLRTVTGIWFPGGDQSPLAAALRGSKALAAIHDRYRAGAVIGGTSAGAAVMSDSMITGNQFWPGMTTAVDSPSFSRIARRAIEIVPGLGFVHNAIVDQHFIRRQRSNRLLSVVLERPSLLGVGIDEGTALEVTPGGKWMVLGKSSIIVLDARRSAVTSSAQPTLGAANIRISVLPAGSTYDPGSGEATLPGTQN